MDHIGNSRSQEEIERVSDCFPVPEGSITARRTIQQAHDLIQRVQSAYTPMVQLWKLAKCAKLTDYFPTQHNESEYTVAVDGDTGLIGTYRNVDSGDDSGTAGVFIRGSEFGRWTLAAKLTASDADDQDII